MANPGRNEILQEAMRHRRALTCYTYSMLHDWSLAEDAVQEATIAASDKYDKFRGESSVLTWLKAIARTKALDIIRKRRREDHWEPDSLDRMVEETVRAQLGDAESEHLERRRLALYACMQSLRQDALELLLGFYRDRCACDVLAERHGRTANAVWLVLSRSRKQLRTCMQNRMTAEA